MFKPSRRQKMLLLLPFFAMSLTAFASAERAVVAALPPELLVCTDSPEPPHATMQSEVALFIVDLCEAGKAAGQSWARSGISTPRSD